MLKLFVSTGALITFAMCSVDIAVAANTSKVDLTPVFKGMERDCAGSNLKFLAALEWLSTRTGTAPIIAKASPELRAALGTGQIKVRDDGDAWTITMPVTNASYRGAPVIGVDRWVGKESGINGISLNFADTPARVSQSIGKIMPTKGDEELTQPQLLAQNGTSRAVLICDFST